MIESILISSLKRQAKKLKANNTSDISFGIKAINGDYEPAFIVLQNGKIVEYGNSSYTPLLKLLGIMDYGKYDLVGGDKILKKSLKSLCEKGNIESFDDLFILVTYNSKENSIILTLFNKNENVRKLLIDELIN